jgi:hypothetical protein
MQHCDIILEAELLGEAIPVIRLDDIDEEEKKEVDQGDTMSVRSGVSGYRYDFEQQKDFIEMPSFVEKK